MTFGQLRPAGERWQLQFTRRLAHRPEKVWKAITEPEHLATWFPTDIEGDRSTGATLKFVFRENEGPTLAGTMLVYEPYSVLEMQWGDEETLRFELEPDGDGTVLTFINTIATLGKAARDGAGWHSCLDALEADLDGRPAPGDTRQIWAEVHDKYVEAFGPEAATIGPPG